MKQVGRRLVYAVVVLAVIAGVAAAIVWAYAEGEKAGRKAAEREATELAEKLEAGKEAHAILRLRAVRIACETYYANPQSGNEWPKNLGELVRPPFGGSSFLRNGEEDLLDPWSKTFQYAVGKNEEGGEMPFVWTERMVNGKTKVIGTKPPPRKE